MLHGSPSPDVGASELTRLLARLAQAPSAVSPGSPGSSGSAAPAAPPGPRPVFAQRLGHWLGWTGAISLASALNAGPSQPAPAPARRVAPGSEAAEFARVKAAMEAAIAAGPREPVSSTSATADFGACRRHCVARQQAMEDAIGALRLRLREALARSSPAGARLAAIDAVMDQALLTHERSLLGLVPLRLQAHFERLQRSEAEHPPWAQAFRAEMDRVLRAELAHRLLPAQGLLDALCTHRTPT